MTATKREIERINQYKKDHLKRITFEVQKDYWDTLMSPAIKKEGMSTNGFIKMCIERYMNCEVIEPILKASGMSGDEFVRTAVNEKIQRMLESQ